MAFLTPPEPSVHELNEMARSLLATIERYRHSVHQADHGGILCQQITGFEIKAGQINPDDFSEDDFELVDNDLGAVINALSDYVKHQVAPRDKVMYERFAQSIQTLTNARSWIYQGFSPDPAKRPGDEELQRQAEDSMRRALRELQS